MSDLGHAQLTCGPRNRILRDLVSSSPFPSPLPPPPFFFCPRTAKARSGDELNPDNILPKALNRVQNVDGVFASESLVLNNKERIPFTLTFHPNNLKFYSQIQKQHQFSLIRHSSHSNAIETCEIPLSEVHFLPT